MQIVNIFGHLYTSGRVVHFTFSPFDSVGVFAETTLDMDMWQTGIKFLNRARAIARSAVRTMGG